MNGIESPPEFYIRLLTLVYTLYKLFAMSLGKYMLHIDLFVCHINQVGRRLSESCF